MNLFQLLEVEQNEVINGFLAKELKLACSRLKKRDQFAIDDADIFTHGWEVNGASVTAAIGAAQKNTPG